MDIMFSIIIPVFNTKIYLEECINSVLSQQFSDYEIVMIDDGSTDGSGEICEQYKNSDSRIKVIHQRNQGLSIARNVGINRARGKYIIFLDSDDMLAENSLYNLEKVINKYQHPNVIVSRRETYNKQNQIFQCAYHFNEECLSKMRNDEKYRELQTLPECWLGAWIFTVSKQYIKEENLYFYPGILHEDEEWVPRVLLRTDSIYFNNSCLYCNRVGREGSITSTMNIKRLFDRLKIVDILKEEFASENYTPEIQYVVNQRMCKLVFGVLRQSNIYRNDKNYKKLIKRIGEKAYILRLSEKKSHHIAYWSYRIIGCKLTGILLGII